MNNPIYPFANYFTSAQKEFPHSIDEQWEIVREIGFDKTYIDIEFENDKFWNDFRRLPSLSEKYGKKLAATFMTLDLPENLPGDFEKKYEIILQTLGKGGTIELGIKVNGEWQTNCSNIQYDSMCMDRLLPLLEKARSAGIIISLYHHFGFWLEKASDCLRLLEKFPHSNLKMTFSSFHWYAVDRSNLTSILKKSSPYLHRVNMCGSRLNPPGSGMPATIETLDQGDFDNVALLRELKNLGYENDIGFQGYGLTGDPKINLKKSFDAYHQMIMGITSA